MVSKSFNPSSGQMEQNSCLKFGSDLFCDLNLDGQCSPIIFKLKLPPNNLNTHGLLNNWESGPFGLLGGTTFGVPPGSDFCDVPEPGGFVGIRCYTFDLEMEIPPCDGAECPILKFTKQVTICCECEIFPGNN